MSQKIVNKSSIYQTVRNSPTGLCQPAQLLVGEFSPPLSIEKRTGVRKNQLCKDVIEQVWTSGQRNQLQLRYVSERSVETVHTRRTRLHDDY